MWDDSYVRKDNVSGPAVKSGTVDDLTAQEPRLEVIEVNIFGNQLEQEVKPGVCENNWSWKRIVIWAHHVLL
jgi:hypothetical protein